MNTLRELCGQRTEVAPMPDQTKMPPRILMVEDDKDLLRYTARMMVRAGHAVDTADDGAAGWEALQINHYDLLITDHNMPKVTGVELVKKLRAASMALPVILASGALPIEELERNPSLQFAATLEKPFTIEELLDAVRKVLRAATGQGADPVAAMLKEPATYG